MINSVTLIGNLGADPEIHTLNNGDKVANFNLATTKKWKSKDGQPQEKTQWHSVKTFNQGLVRVIETYIKKGSKVFITGEIEYRKWDKDGETRYATDIVIPNFGGQLVMLDSKQNAPQQSINKAEPEQPLNDEIPF